MRSPLAHDTVSPPKRAAATLSGWPSARAAASSSASRDSAFPASAPPATRPATHAAALEPRPRLGGIRFTQRRITPWKGRPASSKAWRTARATTLSAPVGSAPAPSPSTVTATRSLSSAVTSLWSPSASPSTSKPGPMLADVAGTRTVTRTSEPLEQPLGGQAQRPRVEGDVVVRHHEQAHHDQQHARHALDDGDERTVALEEAQEGAEGQREEEKGNAEPR